MLQKRIIPCLDIQNGRTVKGVHFLNLRDAGDPIALAEYYANHYADELVFLDISATEEDRKTWLHIVLEIAKAIDIPFSVGGGISSLFDVEQLLQNGADKVCVNSAAIKNPQLIEDIAKRFGSQCVVVAIDAKKNNDNWTVYQVGGKQQTDKHLFHWAKEAEQRGAGEILFTSMDHDGTKNGFAYQTLKKLTEILTIPVIASGGAGKIQDFVDVFTLTNVDAALAATIFHFKEVEIITLKKTLQDNQIPVRL